jgi:hypothetical protein
MKKSLIITALLGLAALALWGAALQRQTPVAVAAPLPAAGPPPSTAAPQAQAQAPKQASAQAQDVAPPAAPPTAAEAEVLTMYDEMTTAFELHHDDCRGSGMAIETLIESHKGALQALRDERAKLSPEQWTAAQDRLAKTQGDRLERMRHAIEQTVARCSTNPRLQNALRQLATLSQ